MNLKTFLDLEELIRDPNIMYVYVDLINNIELYEQLKELIIEQKDSRKLFREVLYFQKKFVERTLSFDYMLNFFEVYNLDPSHKCTKTNEDYEFIVRIALENYDRFEQKTIQQKQMLEALLELKKKVCEKWHFEP